jgi:4-coumarate--CoA ligase
MAAETIIRSTYPPVEISDGISLPQFMTRYNPDNVRSDKVVHVDLIKGKELTYGGLRESAGRASWGLKERLGLKPGNVVCVLVQNSVGESSALPTTRY